MSYVMHMRSDVNKDEIKYSCTRVEQACKLNGEHPNLGHPIDESSEAASSEQDVMNRPSRG